MSGDAVLRIDESPENHTGECFSIACGGTQVEPLLVNWFADPEPSPIGGALGR
jgi:hypothetical protein